MVPELAQTLQLLGDKGFDGFYKGETAKKLLAGVKQAAAAVGGKGGGRPDMAQGGGVDVAALDQALALAVPFVEQGL